MDNQHYNRKEVFACSSCQWIDLVAIPSDKPALDVLDGQWCSGCGEGGMTFYRLHGVRQLVEEWEAGVGDVVRWMDEKGPYRD